MKKVISFPTPAPIERGDALCQENDGCPTEKAVLQRFWREHQVAAPSPSASSVPVAWRYKHADESDDWWNVSSVRCTKGEGIIEQELGVIAAAPSVLTDERIVQIFYPMGTATDNQKLIAIAIGRALLQANGATK